MHQKPSSQNDRKFQRKDFTSVVGTVYQTFFNVMAISFISDKSENQEVNHDTELEVQQNYQGVWSSRIHSLFSKAHSSPYCCSVLLDPRMLLYDYLQFSFIHY